MPQSLKYHLQALLPAQVLTIFGDADVLVTAPFEEDNRQVVAGGVFVARLGRDSDGHLYIANAIARGAVAIVGEQPLTDCSVPYVQMQNAQAAIGLLAASYHNFPSRDLIVVGVTGTDGKTTTSTLIHALLKHALGDKVGLISTISADFGGKSMETGLHVTTPSAPAVQAFLAMMRAAGLTHVVLEMTSHGLAQQRLNGIEIDVAVLTNITHEHLDYHGTWENYRHAKSLLFRQLSSSRRKGSQRKVSILNADDPSVGYFSAIPTDETITYAIETGAALRATNIRYQATGTTFTLNDEQTVQTCLFGRFNVSNTLAAIATARALGIEASTEALSQVSGVSGRMQALHEGQAFIAMVDFAHTPNALRNVLETARQLIAEGGQLIVVFGSAGLRDVEKRRLMAETAAHLADFAIITAEDPRTESLDSILETMALAAMRAGGVEGVSFTRVRDRGDAIDVAVRRAQPGDIVLVCGKGHEQSMCFGTTEYPWDDREALRSALRGFPLHTLPTSYED